MTNTTAAPNLDPDSSWRKQEPSFSLVEIADVAVDSVDRLYIFTRRHPMVLVYSPEGDLLNSWGVDNFVRPHAITITDDEIFCVDDSDCTIKKFTLEGDQISMLGTPGQLSDTGADWTLSDTTSRLKLIRREGGPPFNHPTCVAIAPNGELYISDGYGNCRIHRYSSTGTYLTSWGYSGSGPGEFRLPHAITFTPQGLVLVADRENDRIQVFTAEGDYVEQWCDVQRPTSIAIGKDGLVYVSELRVDAGHYSFRLGEIPKTLPARISVLDLSGAVVARFGATGQLGDPGVMMSPHGITVDSKGNVYVAELALSAHRLMSKLGAELPDIETFNAVQKLSHQ